MRKQVTGRASVIILLASTALSQSKDSADKLLDRALKVQSFQQADLDYTTLVKPRGWLHVPGHLTIPTPPPPPFSISGDCQLLPGKQNIMFQGFLFLCCVGVLIFKEYHRINLKSNRTWVEFALDSSKQLCGTGWLFVVNRLFVQHLQGDPCDWNFVKMIVETTLGLYVEYQLLSRITRLMLEEDNAYETGEYMDAKGSVILGRYFKQLAVWLAVVTGMKVVTSTLVFLGADAFRTAAIFILTPVNGYPQLKLLVVTILTPLFTNALQLCIVDDFIKKQCRQNDIYDFVKPKCLQNDLEEALLDAKRRIEELGAAEAALARQQEQDRQYNKLVDKLAEQQEQIAEQKKELVKAQSAVLSVKMSLLEAHDDRLLKQQERSVSPKKIFHRCQSRVISPKKRHHSMDAVRFAEQEQIIKQEQVIQEDSIDAKLSVTEAIMGPAPTAQEPCEEPCVGPTKTQAEEAEAEVSQEFAIRATIRKLATATVMLKYCSSNARKNPVKRFQSCPSPRRRSRDSRDSKEDLAESLSPSKTLIYLPGKL